ncbi:MAG: HAD-IIIA family hydrolase [Planctomycetes bacterium]|nr:HAD-IIIA family hydrolase [Planctomycetota bacterium]
MKRRAAFLDRDGTLICERRGLVRAPGDVRLLPGSGAALRRLNAAGFAVVILTNQSAVARGIIDETALRAIHDELRRRLLRHGARVDAIYYCPHHPTAGGGRYRKRCRCRKPARGLLARAVRDLGLALRGSIVAGDDLRDLELARGSAARPVLVRTGKGREREDAARRSFGARLLVYDRLLDAVTDLVRPRQRDAGAPQPATSGGRRRPLRAGTSSRAVRAGAREAAAAGATGASRRRTADSTG